MPQPQEGHEEIAVLISEMAATVFDVPQDELGLKTADDCARMLQILSNIPVGSTDEPFIPPFENLKADEGAK